MSLADLVTNVAQEVGYKVDTIVVGSEDETTRQLYRLANRIIAEMASEYDWAQLYREYTYTLSNGVSVYALPGDIDWQKFETMWNRSKSWPIYGPITEQERQVIKSGITPVVYDRFQIRGVTSTQIELFPEPGAADDGSIVAFEYASNRYVRPATWVTGAPFIIGDYTFYNGNYYQATSAGTSGATPPTWTSGSSSDGGVTWAYYSGAYSEFVADTDEPILSERVLELGVMERFAERKGIEFIPRYAQQLRVEFAKSSPGKFLYLNEIPISRGVWVRRLTSL